MTLGRPNNASLPIVLFIYQIGFQRWDIGYAAAASEILFAIILVAAMTQFFASRGARGEHDGAQARWRLGGCRGAGRRGVGDGRPASVTLLLSLKPNGRAPARHGRRRFIRPIRCRTTPTSWGIPRYSAGSSTAP